MKEHENLSIDSAIVSRGRKNRQTDRRTWRS